MSYNNYKDEIFKVKVTPSHATDDYDENDDPEYEDREPFITGVNIFKIGPIVKQWAIYYRDTQDTPTAREIKDPKKFTEFLGGLVNSAFGQYHNVVKNKLITCYIVHPDYDEESDSIHITAKVVGVNYGHKISKEDGEALMQL